MWPLGLGKRHKPSVLAGGIHSLAHNLHDIFRDELLFSTEPHPGIISLHELTMLDKLGQLGLGQEHQPIYFCLGPVEVLQSKCIDSHNLDSTLVADL